jgi:hypothetical protein
MAMNALTTQLPGVLPDLFRRPEQAPARADDTATASPHTNGTATTAQGDEQRALAARTADDTSRLLARRAALGPLTYGRSTMSAPLPAAAPVGMRGAHLDVRG